MPESETTSSYAMIRSLITISRAIHPNFINYKNNDQIVRLVMSAKNVSDFWLQYNKRTPTD